MILVAGLMTACNENKNKNKIDETPIMETPVTDPLVIGEDPIQKKDLQNTSEDETRESEVDKSSPVVSGRILEDWTWEKDGDYTVVRGRLLNDGETPIGFFRIRAEYLNENEDLVDSDSTVYGEVIWPGHQKMFKISNRFESSHFSVQIWVDEVLPAKEPVIHAAEGTNAEIMEGWTWTVDGNFSYIKGHLMNTGEKTIRYYKIIAEYGDGQGQVLDSDFTNSNEKVRPGGQQDFQIMHPYDNAFKEVTIYISNIK